jgi:hypothetical protein
VLFRSRMMFEEREAPFRFVAGRNTPAETLWLDPWDLIERAEEQAQLWARVRPRIPSLSWVPALCSNSSTEHIHIGEGIWPVLSAVDGQRGVGAIAEALSMAPLDVCVALLSLLDQGLITIKQPRPAALEPRPAAPQAAGGFFERLIAGISAAENDSPDLPVVDAEGKSSSRSRAGHE